MNGVRRFGKEQSTLYGDADFRRRCRGAYEDARRRGALPPAVQRAGKMTDEGIARLVQTSRFKLPVADVRQSWPESCRLRRSDLRIACANPAPEQADRRCRNGAEFSGRPDEPETEPEIGFLTPPIGLNILIAMVAFRESFGLLVRSVLPFLAIMVVALAIVTAVPWFSMALIPQ